MIRAIAAVLLAGIVCVARRSAASRCHPFLDQRCESRAVAVFARRVTKSVAQMDR